MAVAQVLRSPNIGPQEQPFRPRCLTSGFIARATVSTAVNANPLALAWGTNHSSGGDESKRASWDDAELEDLWEKLELFRTKFPSGCIPPHAPVVPQLLKMIHADPKAVPIYAKRHILDSSRLATGELLYLHFYLP